MTGLAIVVLRENGTPASDAQIQKGLAWLKVNQRESGRLVDSLPEYRFLALYHLQRNGLSAAGTADV